MNEDDKKKDEISQEENQTFVEALNELSISLEPSLIDTSEKTVINPLYSKMLQGPATHALTAINSKSTHTVDMISGDWIYPTERNGNIVITVKNGSKNKLSLSTSKLLDIISIYLSKSLPFGPKSNITTQMRTLSINIQGYIKLCGLKDKYEAVKKLKKDLNTLMETHIELSVTRKNEKGKIETNDISMNILDSSVTGTINKQLRDYATITVTESFARYLTTSFLMHYPLQILYSYTNSNIYYIGKKLSEHYNMNKGKTNENYIRLATILTETPDIPSLEKEKSGKRNYRQKCIEPLEKTLNNLKELKVLQDWSFLDSEKNKMETEEIYKQCSSFESWNNLVIYFAMNNYPEAIQLESELKDNIEELSEKLGVKNDLI